MKMNAPARALETSPNAMNMTPSDPNLTGQQQAAQPLPPQAAPAKMRAAGVNFHYGTFRALTTFRSSSLPTK